jgi:hypothetical protein
LKATCCSADISGNQEKISHENQKKAADVE